MVVVMSEDHKRKIKEGRDRYYAEKRAKVFNMPFIKRKPIQPRDEELEQHSSVPQRDERMQRITREVREEPVYEDNVYEDEDDVQSIPKPIPHAPSSVTLKLTLDEMRHDAAAHAFLVNSVAQRFAGMPQHIIEFETNRVCAVNLKRLRDIDACIKKYQE